MATSKPSKPKRTRLSPTDRVLVNLETQRDKLQAAYNTAMDKAVNRVEDTYRAKLLSICASIKALKQVRDGEKGGGDEPAK